MNVLITGFEPFGGMSQNPSSALVSWAEQEVFPGADVKAMTLPVTYSKCAEPVVETLHRWKPDVVLLFGVAAGRQAVTLERIAVNIEDAPGLTDNDGEAPVDRPVVKDGPDAYFSTLPLRSIMENLHEEGIPAAFSYSAGTYICNTTMYRVLHEAAEHGLPLQAGFIHLPASPDMFPDGSKPTMAPETVQKALRTIMNTIIKKEAAV
ncbi:pyroglutamyl-peptidase I [Alkalicoccus luteus]|uniref:Pyroglutamyl-peptidase I n=1 Tax=Alkalicoccus luteus TaxID=1237094 RepID=A0A969TSP8_9BACI|nr:pyroglutamyl-peptidase I [Alkalicoccus luteus]